MGGGKLICITKVYRDAPPKKHNNTGTLSHKSENRNNASGSGKYQSRAIWSTYDTFIHA